MAWPTLSTDPCTVDIAAWQAACRAPVRGDAWQVWEVWIGDQAGLAPADWPAAWREAALKRVRAWWADARAGSIDHVATLPAAPRGAPAANSAACPKPAAMRGAYKPGRVWVRFVARTRASNMPWPAWREATIGSTWCPIGADYLVTRIWIEGGPAPPKPAGGTGFWGRLERGVKEGRAAAEAAQGAMGLAAVTVIGGGLIWMMARKRRR